MPRKSKAKKETSKAKRDVIGRGLPERQISRKDISLSTNVNTTPDLTLLNGLTVGTTGIGDRLGTHVILKSFHLSITCTAGTTAQFQTIRYSLVYDNAPNGVLPLYGSIYNTTTSNYPMTVVNLDYSKRFSILWTELFNLNGTTTSTVPGNSHIMDVYRDLGNKETRYGSGTAGTIADISNGALYLCSFGSQAPGTTAAIGLGIVRIRYEA